MEKEQHQHSSTKKKKVTWVWNNMRINYNITFIMGRNIHRF